MTSVQNRCEASMLVTFKTRRLTPLRAWASFGGDGIWCSSLDMLSSIIAWRDDVPGRNSIGPECATEDWMVPRLPSPALGLERSALPALDHRELRHVLAPQL